MNKIQHTLVGIVALNWSGIAYLVMRGNGQNSWCYQKPFNLITRDIALVGKIVNLIELKCI